MGLIQAPELTTAVRRVLLSNLGRWKALPAAQMTQNERKRAFSEAWLRAIAAAAGFGIQGGTTPDDQSVDITITSRLKGIATNPRLDVQLKCTETDIVSNGVVKFSLRQNNYDDLRDTNVAVPIILVLVLVPSDSPWLLSLQETLQMYKSAWWISLRGFPDSGNAESTTISIPDGQRFTIEALQDIMNKLAW